MVEKKIVIENLLGINKLEFVLPDKKGVYIIVGQNGSGKSTLLTCIDRIVNPNAFANNFIRQSYSGNIDMYDKSKISYFVDSENVYFTKGKNRWSPHPRNNYQDTLSKLEYKSSNFVKADANRIGLKIEDITNEKVIDVNNDIKEALNRIFDTNKFNNLFYIESRKKGKRAVKFYAFKENDTYYTERRFSTGEIATIRLLENIENSTSGIILLDEVEMALHPKIQKTLIDYLKNKANDNNITIFVSTHSPIVINSVEKENIYLIEKNDYALETKVINPCYQSYAIGCVDNIIFSTYEYIIYVEDVMAMKLFNRMFDRYFQGKVSRPRVICFPTGGYEQTYKMAKNVNDNMTSGLSKNGHVYAIFDYDVYEDKQRIDGKTFDEFYKENKDIVFWFNFTPEKYIIENIKNNDDSHYEFLQKLKMEMNTVAYTEIKGGTERDNGRGLAKKQLEYLIRKVKSKPGESEDETSNIICDIVVKNMEDNDLNSLFNRLFK